MIIISPEHADMRLYATLEFIGSGSDEAKIYFYDGTQPDPGDTPTGDLVATMYLAAIPGEIDGQVLTLIPDEDATIVKSSLPTWARCVNANDLWTFDCTCSDDLGSGDIKFDADLFAGGAIHLNSCELT